jgi:hypothetical protein
LPVGGPPCISEQLDLIPAMPSARSRIAFQIGFDSPRSSNGFSS